MTSYEITKAILSKRYFASMVFPTITPASWFECDVLEITKAGYFREYEIKTSRSDFFADKKKCKWNSKAKSVLTKHERIAAKDPLGPSSFYFCTPRGLILPDEIPEWAGLIEFEKYTSLYIRQVETKKAPRLHSEPARESIRTRVYLSAYNRVLPYLVNFGRDDQFVFCEGI